MNNDFMFDVECFDRRLKVFISSKELFHEIYGDDDIDTFDKFVLAIEAVGGRVKDFYANP